MPDWAALRARSVAVSGAGITGVKGELPWAERGGDASHSVALLAVYSSMWVLITSALVLDFSVPFPVVDSQAWGCVQGSEIV